MWGGHDFLGRAGGARCEDSRAWPRATGVQLSSGPEARRRVRVPLDMTLSPPDATNGAVNDRSYHSIEEVSVATRSAGSIRCCG